MCSPISPYPPPTPYPASFETFTKLLYISRTFVQMSSQSGERASLKNPSRSRIRPSSGSRGSDVDRQRVKCRQIKSWRPGDSSTRASRGGKKNETPENPKKRGGGARSGGERQLIRVDLAAGGDSHFHPEHVQHSSPPTVAGGEEWDGRERGGGRGRGERLPYNARIRQLGHFITSLHRLHRGRITDP